MSLASGRVQLGIDQLCLDSFEIAEIESPCEGDIPLLDPAVRFPHATRRSSDENILCAAEGSPFGLHESGGYSE